MKTPHYDYMMIEALAGSFRDEPAARGLSRLVGKNLLNARIFKIPAVLSEVFILTDPIKTYVLPFESVFLEQQVKTENYTINGIYLYSLSERDKTEIDHKGDSIHMYVNIAVNGVRASIHRLLNSYNERHKSPMIAGRGVGEAVELLSQYNVNDTAKNIVYNFLCFVNSPDIEYITKTDTDRETKIRIRKGKPPRPPIANIILTNPLKRYIQKQRIGEKMTYTHRFWVRGHWRHYQNSKYVNLRGKKQWIKPHIKGDGLLIPKN